MPYLHRDRVRDRVSVRVRVRLGYNIQAWNGETLSGDGRVCRTVLPVRATGRGGSTSVVSHIAYDISYLRGLRLFLYPQSYFFYRLSELAQATIPSRRV